MRRFATSSDNTGFKDFGIASPFASPCETVGRPGTIWKLAGKWAGAGSGFWLIPGAPDKSSAGDYRVQGLGARVKTM
jgi:hypothetical protein